MFYLIAKILKPRFMIPLLLVVIVVQGYFLVKPRVPRPDSLRRSIAEDLCWEAVKNLEGDLQDHLGRSMAVARFQNDSSRYVTEKMTEILARKASFSIREENYIDNIMKKLEIDEGAGDLINTLISKVKSWDADILVSGNLREFRSSRNRASMTIFVKAVDTRDKRIISSFTLSEEKYDGPFGRSWNSFMIRCFIWLILVGLVPVIALVPLKNLLDENSNTVNAAILAVFGIGSALAGILIVGSMGPAWFLWSVALGALVISVFYIAWFAGRLVD